MYTTLKMMQSLNGFIAKNQKDDLKWGSSTDKKLYKSLSLEYGTVILGKNTYLAMPKIAFKGRQAVVIVRNLEQFLLSQTPNNSSQIIQQTFRKITIGKIIDEKLTFNNFTFVELGRDNKLDDLMQYLEFNQGDKNTEKTLVVGGGVINSLFLTQNLINEIHITIAPKIFGSGIEIFNSSFNTNTNFSLDDLSLDVDLTLQKVEQITDNELLLVYKINQPIN